MMKKMMKKKGYAKGGMKKKGYAKGGAKMMKKGYAKGGMTKKGSAKGGAKMTLAQLRKAAKDKVSLKVTEKANVTSFIIEDDGCGIAQSLRDDILQRGTRADTYQHGHGIGLAIVRDLVDSYHGNIAIETSTLLTGAKFTINFTQ